MAVEAATEERDGFASDEGWFDNDTLFYFLVVMLTFASIVGTILYYKDQLLSPTPSEEENEEEEDVVETTIKHRCKDPLCECGEQGLNDLESSEEEVSDQEISCTETTKPTAHTDTINNEVDSPSENLLLDDASFSEMYLKESDNNDDEPRAIPSVPSIVNKFPDTIAMETASICSMTPDTIRRRNLAIVIETDESEIDEFRKSPKLIDETNGNFLIIHKVSTESDSEDVNENVINSETEETLSCVLQQIDLPCVGNVIGKNDNKTLKSDDDGLASVSIEKSHEQDKPQVKGDVNELCLESQSITLLTNVNENYQQPVCEKDQEDKHTTTVTDSKENQQQDTSIPSPVECHIHERTEANTTSEKELLENSDCLDSVHQEVVDEDLITKVEHSEQNEANFNGDSRLVDCDVSYGAEHAEKSFKDDEQSCPDGIELKDSVILIPNSPEPPDYSNRILRDELTNPITEGIVSIHTRLQNTAQQPLNGVEQPNELEEENLKVNNEKNTNENGQIVCEEEPVVSASETIRVYSEQDQKSLWSFGENEGENRETTTTTMGKVLSKIFDSDKLEDVPLHKVEQLGGTIIISEDGEYAIIDFAGKRKEYKIDKVKLRKQNSNVLNKRLRDSRDLSELFDHLESLDCVGECTDNPILFKSSPDTQRKFNIYDLNAITKRKREDYSCEKDTNKKLEKEEEMLSTSNSLLTTNLDKATLTGDHEDNDDGEVSGCVFSENNDDDRPPLSNHNNTTGPSDSLLSSRPTNSYEAVYNETNKDTSFCYSIDTSDVKDVENQTSNNRQILCHHNTRNSKNSYEDYKKNTNADKSHVNPLCCTQKQQQQRKTDDVELAEEDIQRAEQIISEEEQTLSFVSPDEEKNSQHDALLLPQQQQPREKQQSRNKIDNIINSNNDSVLTTDRAVDNTNYPRESTKNANNLNSIINEQRSTIIDNESSENANVKRQDAAVVKQKVVRSVIVDDKKHIIIREDQDCNQITTNNKGTEEIERSDCSSQTPTKSDSVLLSSSSSQITFVQLIGSQEYLVLHRRSKSLSDLTQENKDERSKSVVVVEGDAVKRSRSMECLQQMKPKILLSSAKVPHVSKIKETNLDELMLALRSSANTSNYDYCGNLSTLNLSDENNNNNNVNELINEEQKQHVGEPLEEESKDDSALLESSYSETEIDPLSSESESESEVEPTSNIQLSVLSRSKGLHDEEYLYVDNTKPEQPTNSDPSMLLAESDFHQPYNKKHLDDSVESSSAQNIVNTCMPCINGIHTEPNVADEKKKSVREQIVEEIAPQHMQFVESCPTILQDDSSSSSILNTVSDDRRTNINNTKDDELAGINIVAVPDTISKQALQAAITITTTNRDFIIEKANSLVKKTLENATEIILKERRLMEKDARIKENSKEINETEPHQPNHLLTMDTDMLKHLESLVPSDSSTEMTKESNQEKSDKGSGNESENERGTMVIIETSVVAADVNQDLLENTMFVKESSDDSENETQRDTIVTMETAAVAADVNQDLLEKAKFLVSQAIQNAKNLHLNEMKCFEVEDKRRGDETTTSLEEIPIGELETESPQQPLLQIDSDTLKHLESLLSTDGNNVNEEISGDESETTADVTTEGTSTLTDNVNNQGVLLEKAKLLVNQSIQDATERILQEENERKQKITVTEDLISETESSQPLLSVDNDVLKHLESLVAVDTTNNELTRKSGRNDNETHLEQVGTKSNSRPTDNAENLESLVRSPETNQETDNERTVKSGESNDETTDNAENPESLVQSPETKTNQEIDNELRVKSSESDNKTRVNVDDVKGGIESEQNVNKHSPVLPTSTTTRVDKESSDSIDATIVDDLHVVREEESEDDVGQEEKEEEEEGMTGSKTTSEVRDGLCLFTML